MSHHEAKTPFRTHALRVAALAIAGALAGCAPSYDVFLDGQIYDGASGERLTTYEMTIEYRDQKIQAKVSDTGRFTAQLPVFQDYTVTIKADGYRPFRSHNAGFNVPNPESPLERAQGNQTRYYDAYLFPEKLVAPAVSLNVRKDASTGELASGKVRVRPASLSSLADTDAELPAGVPTQLWSNDEDLQAKPIVRDFTAGNIQIAAGELVYGVEYHVNIYDVAGYQPFEGSLTAGTDGTRTLVLTAENSDPLVIVSSTAANCRGPLAPTDSQSATVSFEFNTEIELAPNPAAGGWAEVVDNAFSISSPDVDADLQRNALRASTSATEQERGTRMQPITGKTLTFTWNASAGLLTSDPNDPITATWNLGNVQIRAKGRSQAKTLATLLGGAGTVVCAP